MSIHHIAWVLKHSEAKYGARLVLIALANHANDTHEAYPSVPTLAAESRLTDRAVQAALRQLGNDGEVERTDIVSRHGTCVYRLPDPWRPPEVSSPPAESSGVKSATEGVKSATEYTSQTSPNTSVKPSVKPSGGRECAPAVKVAGKRVDQDAPPSTLPDQLVVRLESALEVLLRVHAERGGIVPTTRGVGLALSAFPKRDHVAVALELEHWVLAGNGQGRQPKDLVRLYRTFLDRAPAASPARGSTNGQPLGERERRRARRGAALDSLIGEGAKA